MVSSELYRTLVEQSAEGLWVLDDAGRTVFANPRLTELLGVPREDLVGRDHADFLDDTGRAQWELRRQRLDAQGASRVPVECRFVRADGTPAWFLVTEARLHDDTGSPRGLLLSLSEHDERRRAADDLARSRGELLAAQRIARLGSWAWDAGTDSLTVSPALRHLFDHDPAVFPMRLEQALEIFEEPERERLRTLNAPLLEGEADSSDFEVATTGADGPVWLRVRAVPDRDDDGMVRGLAGTLQDVTQTHLEEDALRDLAHQNALMQRIAVAANQSPTLVDALLATGELVVEHDDWTHARAFWPADDGGDLAPGPAIGRAEVGEPDPAIAARELRTARRAFEAGVSTWDDEERLTLASPVMLDDEPVAVIAISSEPPLYRHAIITSMLEQVVLQLSTVAQREAGARELATARDTAMEASRQKSEFLATMSHEIRTPLNGVIGLNDLLRATELDAHQHRLTTGVAASGRALLAIVDDILDFSKIEAGLMEVEEIDLDPRQVLDDVAAMTAQAATARGVRLVVRCDRRVPPLVRSDRARLTQVLANLVSNAVKFTAGGGEVLVSADVVEAPAGERTPEAAGEVGTAEPARLLTVAVTDTGVGIPPERLQGIFDPFIQADASTTREYGGTGLGLAIVREIVTALGGEVDVTSEPGVGSTFRFHVPLVLPDSPSDAPPDAPPGSGVPAGRSALVVQACPTQRDADVEALAHWGLEVTGVAPEEVAAHLAAHGAPDVAVVGRDGADAGARRAEEEALTALDGVPMVVLDGPGRGTRPPGPTPGLERPVPAGRLRDVVAAALRGETAAPEPVVGAHGASAAAPADGTPADGPTTTRGRVLVVEDTPINQMVAEGLIAALGYASESVDDGVEALARLEAADGGFDLVLMDVQMPRLDGYATSRAIRDRERVSGAARLPIVAMTAAAVTGERERCLAAGMDDFLTKPVSPARLATVLADRLGDLRPAAPSAAAPPGAGQGAPGSAEPGGAEPGGAEPGGAEPGDAAGGIPAGPPVPEELREHLDLERLDMLRDLDPGNTTYVDRVVGNFVSRTPALHEAVAEAVRAGDATALSAVAHRLRGSALNLGVPRVAEIALGLELAGERDDLTGAAEQVAALAVALEHGRDAVLAYRASHGS